jgi:hypothetical protein
MHVSHVPLGLVKRKRGREEELLTWRYAEMAGRVEGSLSTTSKMGTSARESAS